MTPLVAVLVALATYRITILATVDDITEIPRIWLLERWSWLPLDCPFCASMWVAPPVAASALAWSNGWGWLLVAVSLSASAVTGIIAQWVTP